MAAAQESSQSPFQTAVAPKSQDRLLNMNPYQQGLNQESQSGQTPGLPQSDHQQPQSQPPSQNGKTKSQHLTLDHGKPNTEQALQENPMASQKPDAFLDGAIEQKAQQANQGPTLDPKAPQIFPQRQRPSNRGPIWASRPDDEQRQKNKQIKAEQAAGNWKPQWTILSSANHHEKEKHKTLQHHKSADGSSHLGSKLSGLFDDTRPANKPSFHLFGPASSVIKKKPSTNSVKDKVNEAATSSSPSSRWADNPKKLRSAFQHLQGTGEPEPKSSPGNKATLNQSPDNEVQTPTPIASTQQKRRAFTKIVLGSGYGVKATGPPPNDDNQPTNGQTTSKPDSNKVSTEAKVDGPPLTPTTAHTRWTQLIKKVKDSQKAKKEEAKNRATGLDLTKELQTGILPVFLLKMAIERDVQNHRRIPILLNHLRLRVTDSVNPLHNMHAVFRIELEYGDGLVKWVVYRELRDFIKLHAHYRAAALRGYLGRSIGNAEGDFGLPSFPKMSLPYFNQLQRQARTSKAEFAKAQRDALENYIIELIRRTMFRAEANRLCKFFEISALSVSLASRGGAQGKQGYLRILSKSSRKQDQKAILTPARWAKAHEPKWFIVRESFIVIVKEPDTLQIYDVFLMDNDFAIERPKRLYKQTIHLTHGLTHSDDKPAVKSSEQVHSKIEQDLSNAAETHQAYDQTALLTDGNFHDKTTQGYNKDDPNRHASSHTFYIKNSERRLKLVARNERQMEQFIASMERMSAHNIFGKTNRFDSFAPIRLNTSAQWLVDGRDYFWNVSKALMMAKDRIIIHDWWLSPELYLRRPGHPKWRLDNILKKKAQEGVKIFVIIYNEVLNNFTPTDSNYTKQRLIGLHPNIFVQRSPSHFQTGTLYWAHHEKMCVIDETIAFMGGLDLCFGRWDTPSHSLIDDAYCDSQDGHHDVVASHPDLLGPARGGKEAHIWPGQDYANERVMEWHTLSKPHEDLFPRDKFPRMPWHDVGIQLVGQPARDLCRHFSQRWNLLLRTKNHSRMMPFLIPPPDFNPDELQKYGLTGTCEVQICRSAGPWSLGTGSKVECSIQNAYLKAIQMSEHFVYIENQFFVTSTVVEGNKIENKIGEALVSRIIRAHRQGTAWRAIILIPLIPGFPMPIDHPDASAVRLIVELQNRSIARGEHSIFGKLRREGINPEDYIGFFSLRSWGKLRGGQLTTEQIYIHDKIMIVDDRLAIIGSANINERSMRGDRDSELACVVRDFDMTDSKMAGRPYKVGRFAHSLRVHLMREHLGVDVDELEAQEARNSAAQPSAAAESSHRANSEAHSSMAETETGWETDQELPTMNHGGGDVSTRIGTFKHENIQQEPLREEKVGVGHHLASNGFDRQSEKSIPRSNQEPGAEESHQNGRANSAKHVADFGRKESVSSTSLTNESEIQEHLHDLGTRGLAVSQDAGWSQYDDLTHKHSSRIPKTTWQPPSETVGIDPYKFDDPLSDAFYKEYWLSSAAHNTQIFRTVFKCVPDDTVSTWSEYKAFQAWADRLARSGKFSSKESREQRETQAHSAPGASVGGPVGQRPQLSSSLTSVTMSVGGGGGAGSEATEEVPRQQNPAELKGHNQGTASHQHIPTALKEPSAGAPKSHLHIPSTEGFSNRQLEQMEELLEQCRGSLVIHPTRFLEAEDMSNNFLFSMDRINPLLIYD